MTLPREEYIEQAYLFRILIERLGQDITIQDLLQHCRFEVLATTKLPCIPRVTRLIDPGTNFRSAHSSNRTTALLNPA